MKRTLIYLVAGLAGLVIIILAILWQPSIEGVLPRKPPQPATGPSPAIAEITAPVPLLPIERKVVVTSSPPTRVTTITLRSISPSSTTTTTIPTTTATTSPAITLPVPQQGTLQIDLGPAQVSVNIGHKTQVKIKTPIATITLP